MLSSALSSPAANALPLMKCNPLQHPPSLAPAGLFLALSDGSEASLNGLVGFTVFPHTASEYEPPSNKPPMLTSTTEEQREKKSSHFFTSLTSLINT